MSKTLGLGWPIIILSYLQMNWSCRRACAWCASYFRITTVNIIDILIYRYINIGMEGLHSYTIFCNRRGEEWYKVRRVLNMKMLKPKVIGEYAQGFNEVSSDLLSRLKQTRDDEGLIPNIKDELFKWSLECEFITLTPPPPPHPHHTSDSTFCFYLSFNFS